MPVARILVVDDEQAIRSVLERLLKREGFQVILAADGQQALDAVHSHKPDLMILDLNLPDMLGEDIYTKIRKDPAVQAVPILVLTGRATDGLSAECLNGGADDYLAKPFDIKELLARVNALLRRPRAYVASDSVIERGIIAIRVGEREVLVKGKPVEKLAPKEFELLKQLVMHAPKVINKNALALSAWGTSSDQLHHRTLDVHMRRIRQKIGPNASRCLKTVPAVGYQWTDH